MAKRGTRAFLSPSEAARRADVSRSTLYRALSDGRLSATRGPDGKKRIDLAELGRVFPLDAPGTPQGVSRDVSPGHTGTPPSSPEITALVASMKARIESLEALVSRLEDDLARERDRADRMLSLVEQKALPPPSWWKRLTGG